MKPSRKPKASDMPAWLRRAIEERRHDPDYRDWLANWDVPENVVEWIPDPQPDPVGRLVPEEWFDWSWVPLARELKKWRIVK